MKAQKTTTQYRQGDVLLEKCAKPSSKQQLRPVPRDRGRIVLAYGEVTGHAHAICEAEAELVELDTGERFLMSDAGMRIVHEEHAPISLPPGNYRVIRQREYSPEAIRNVAD
jgi:hypothetical protein